MDILPFNPTYLPEAAALFIENFQHLRQTIPLLPDLMEDSQRVTRKLEILFKYNPGIMAVDQGKLVGYLGWFLVNRFRDTDRKGAYVPEYGHAAITERKAAIYRAMYRAAGEMWAKAGSQVHAITLLANDAIAEKTWYWSGFGLTVVDAIRPMIPLDTQPPTTLTLKKATIEDTSLLLELDCEHCLHYESSPTFMTPRGRWSVEDIVNIFSHQNNSIWLALDGQIPAGFLYFNGHSFDEIAILTSERTIGISGAYVRPAYRGQRVAASLLNAAISDYAAQGFSFCAVNFESINPEASGLWMRYFQPVCYSLLRVPEAIPLLQSS